MFHLASPFYLLLLALVPLLAWWQLRRDRAAVPHSGLQLFAGLPSGRAWLARYGGLALRLLGLTLLILALAQPRWPDLRTRLATEGIALMLVVDVSGSMAERDFDSNGQPISRLQAVQQIFRLFVTGSSSDEPLPPGLTTHFEGRPTDLIGLICFATRPEVRCPLTLSHEALLQLLQAEQPRGVPGEAETNLSDALTAGLARLRSAGPRRRVLVLLTDGEHNQNQTRSGWTPRQAAQVAASLDIPIYCIDAGNSPAEPDSQTQAVRQQAVATLQQIAHITGGKYFTARDTASLAAACAAIDRLERSPIASFQYRRYHELYPALALGCFVLFVLAAALDATLWRRLP